MTEKILFVDDQPELLATFQFTLGKKFNITTAQGGDAGLAAIRNQGPFAVVVSDLEMPGLDGLHFLEVVKASSPDSVRLMLTSKTDHKTTIEVVNQANIFRFLNKPCTTEMLAKCLNDALQQHRLVMAERDTLERTLGGSVRMMTEVLSALHPQIFERAIALRETVREFAAKTLLPDSWQLEFAALLSKIGCLTIPSEVLKRSAQGSPLITNEKLMLERVPEIGKNLLAGIPRLETVAQIIYYQNKNFDGSGFPADQAAGESIPQVARILRILADVAELKWGGTKLPKTFQIMRDRQGAYDPQLLEKIAASFPVEPESRHDRVVISQPVRVTDLRLGHVLRGNIETSDGTLLVSAGREVTQAILERVRNFAETSGIKEPILVEDRAPGRIAA
jgi:response regulator RpfG family c-di-GMP phosphodiesterase